MTNNSQIPHLIKDSVKKTEPAATLILFGSYARGDNRIDADMDIIILIDKDRLTFQEEVNIVYPLYHLGWNYGIDISTKIITKSLWETRHKISPFNENVMREGIVL